MSPAGVLLSLLRFLLWEVALFAAALWLVELAGFGKRGGVSKVLAALSIEITLEASAGGLLSFTRSNSSLGYLIIAGLCAVSLRRVRLPRTPLSAAWAAGLAAALLVPLLMLAFRPVEEIDSINYLHYLIDWMGNRATPFTFATNYVAFWELSFLPVWWVTGTDSFFPLLALKAVVVLALACWQLGRELALPPRVLAAVVPGSLAMRHFWYEYSGVPTLKNDVLHGAGFVLLVLVVVRASRRPLAPADVWLLALGAAFSTVKYTGLFLAPLALVAVILLRAIDWRGLAAVGALFLATSGPYYLRSLFRYGSPFYPFQINLGPIHLPGTADLSYSSILYNLHDARLWRAFFLPAAGVSPVGLLFPAVLAGTLILGLWRLLVWARHRKAPSPLEWTACFLLVGWLLYFRSVFSATGEPGALSFILNSLNSVRYVDGVLAVSELFLAAQVGRYAMPLAVVNGASRLLLLYAKVPFPLYVTVAAALAAGLIAWFLAKAGIRLLAASGLLAVVAACPLLVEHNRNGWTVYWNDLKPALAKARGAGLRLVALEDGGYFAGHVVAAGIPVDPAVRTISLDELESLAEPSRPPALAILVTPGSAAASDWKDRYGPRLWRAGYRAELSGAHGAVLKRGRE
jgi:hypothetical protein